jgi:tetratricopeptide (TPR) repeat protein
MSAKQVAVSPQAEDKKLTALEVNLKATMEASIAPDADKDLAAAYLLLADYLTELEDFSEAKRNYENAARIFSSSGDKEKLARINLKIGIIENTLGNFERAAEIFDNLRMSDIQDDEIKAGILRLNIQISLGALNEGNLDPAKECYRSLNSFFWPSWSAEKIYPLVVPSLAELLGKLGEKTVEYQKYEDAILYLEVRLSLKDEKKTEDAIRSRIDCLKTLGKAYLEMGRDVQLEDKVEAAYEWYVVALNAFELAKDRSNQAKTLKKIGEVLLAQDQLDQGEENLRRSLEIASEAESQSKELEIWPFFHLELQGVRITDIGTVASSSEQRKNVFLEVDVKNAGNLIWCKNRNIMMSYMWKENKGGGAGSNLQLELNDHLPPKSHMEVKCKVDLPPATEEEYQISCSKQNSYWEKPSGSVISHETVKFSSLDNTYLLITGTTQETKILIVPPVEKIMPEVGKLQLESESPSNKKHLIPKPISFSTYKEPKLMTAIKKVFISYNHKDKDVVDKIKLCLKTAGVPVTIDSESMDPGEGIKSFIESAIRDTDVTLSIVSKNSLLSAWVAMETKNVFSAEVYAKKKFVPCYIDPSFFETSFTGEAIAHIDAEIKIINQEIKKRLSSDAGIEDLQDLRTRYLNLKLNIATIVGRLKESKCIDLTVMNFDSGLNQIIRYLQPQEEKKFSRAEDND